MDLTNVVIPVSNLDIVPREIAVRHLILPVIVKENQIFLAMADPDESRVIEELEFVTSKKVFPYVALHHVLQKIIEEIYRLKEEGQAFYRGSRVSDEKYGKILAMYGGEGRGQMSVPPPAGVSDEMRFLDDSSPTGPTAVIAETTPMPEMPGGRDEAMLDLEDEGSKSSSTDLDTGSRKILVVDDEEDILNLIAKVLLDKGYKVVKATRGREALVLVKSEYPDLIILDAMLPEIHGFDVCKKIKSSQKYGHIPVIMISAIYRGWRFAKDLKESYGVDLFMEKPFKIGELVKAVESHLQREPGKAKPDSRELSIEASRYLDASAKAFKAGDVEKAIEYLKQGIAIDSLSDKLHFNLALLYGRQGMIYYAISELETVLELAPGVFQAMKNLAVLYQQAGFRNKSIEMWERAMGAAPDDETREQIKEHLMGLL